MAKNPKWLTDKKVCKCGCPYVLEVLLKQADRKGEKIIKCPKCGTEIMRSMS